MNTEKNQQKIYESVNRFFQDALKLKDKEFFKKFLKFSSRVPRNAPFNNAIVFIQNPDCTYFATESQWEKFGRTIKKGARPMLILMPFCPVDFVYDISDTEGGDLPDSEILNWWREHEACFDGRVFELTVKNLNGLGIEVKNESPFKYFDQRSIFDRKRDDFRTAGVASLDLKTGKKCIILHPRYNEPSVEAYGVLCHEIAHHLLGHMGEVVYRHKDKKGEEIKTKVVYDRKDTPDNIKELEAEITAWLVFNHFNLKKRSEEYVATWIESEKDVESIAIWLVFKMAGRIQQMGEKIVYR